MNTFDGRKIDALLTMAWLGAITEPDGPSASTRTAAAVQEEETRRRTRFAVSRAAHISKLGEMAASIVHEINQPLTAIQLNGETGLRWLDGEHPNVARARALFERIIQDAGRSLNIVAHIRAMVAGHMPQQTIITLEEVIADAVSFMQHEFNSNDVTVSLDPPPFSAKINGNRSQLEQVIVNLMVNAIQALSNIDAISRRVVVRVRHLPDALVCCIVEDNGPGIDPVHLPHLFDNVFTTRATGMGMGLLISRSIVEAHGGGITADNNSALGGARFTFTIPAADPSTGP